MPIRLQVLGGLHAWREDVPIPWVPAQPISSALLVFLAIEPSVSREQLARVFWPDEDQEASRHALRQALYRLRHAAGEALIEDAGDVLGLTVPVACDALDFERAVDAGDFGAAMALYGGAFLEDLSLSASREFEAWTDRQRARFSRLHRRACRARIENLLHVGALPDAIEAARAWVTLEPYDDEAQHRLIELLAGSGQRAEALVQYERYERLLKGDELEPLDETKALVALLRAGEVGVSALAPALPPPVGLPGPGALEPQVPLRRRSRLTWAGGAVLLVAVICLAAWFALFRQPPAGPTPRVRTFTGHPGLETMPAFSPEGGQLAFAWNGEKQDNFDIYVQRVDGAMPSRLTSDPAVDYSPVWSPDGLDVAFLRDTEAGTEVIRIPAAGGLEQKLHVSPVRITSSWRFCGLAWSPNGKFLALVDRDSETGPRSIFLLNVETRDKQKLTTPPAGGWDGLPAFSPDGGSLAFTRGHDRPLSDIHVLRISDAGRPRGEPRRVTWDNTFVYGVAWTPDGRSIVFSSIRAGVWALWRVSASGGEPERLPVGGNNVFWPSVSRRGNRLAYAEGGDDWNIWRMAAPGGGATGDPAAAPRRFSPSPGTDHDPAFSPDGQTFAWTSTHSGSYQIWLSKSDGSQPHQLTDHEPPGAAKPRWSPDGKQIAFDGYSPGTRKVNVISVDGGAPRRLTSDSLDEDVFGWSRDGRWVYFGSDRGQGYSLWKARVDGGTRAPVLVAPNGRDAVESLDGRFVYYGSVETSDRRDDGSEASIWKLSVSGGSPVLLARNGRGPLESLDGQVVYYTGPEHSIWRVAAARGEPALVLKTGPRASWTIASVGIYVLDPDEGGGPSLEYFPFSGQRPQLVALPGNPDNYLPHPFGVSVSPDGRWILYMRVERGEDDIMLVDNFR